MTVPYSDVIFAFDFSRIESVGGVRYLWDYSPNGFHFAFPGGAADPTPQLDGSLSFDGLDYLALPAMQLARFYAQAPTGASTVLLWHTPAVATGCVWSCWNSGGGGINDGVVLLAQTATTAAPRFYQGQGGAGLPYIAGTLAHGMSWKRVVSYTMETTPRGLTDGTTNGAAWALDAFGAAVYDPVMVPRIGTHPSGAGGYQGRQYFLCWIRGAISSPDMAQLSAMIANGVKPWCVRR
jgi:hypothetical protein